MVTRQGLSRCCVAALIVCLVGTAPAADKPPDPANAAWTLVLESALEALTGTVEARVSDSAGEVERGAYTFTLSGKVIGTAAAGTFKAARDGQALRGGVFAATLKADAWEQDIRKREK